jgi:hypothetical protein
MGIEGAKGQAGGHHHFAYAYVLKSPFTELASGITINPGLWPVHATQK